MGTNTVMRTSTSTSMVMVVANASGPASTPALLQLMWLASPALPIGGFSYSEGLEAAVEWAGLKDGPGVRVWLLDQLQLSLARSELAVLAQAIPAWRAGDGTRLNALNDWVLQTRETSESRQQTQQMGRSMIEWLKGLQPELFELPGPVRLQDPSYPLAFALAASVTEASVRDALHAYAFGWAENMTQAAVKSVPLGQSAGQRVLQALAGAIPSAVELALSLGDEQRQAFCPMLAILGARHEMQYSRLFRS